MEWFTKIFSGGVAKVIDSVGSIIDNVHTSDEEKLKLKNELSAAMNGFTLQMEKHSGEFEKEVTKRWLSDNEHIVTRMLRPISYIFVLVLFAIMVLMDGNLTNDKGQIIFAIKEAYIPVIETLLATMTVAYFGSRGVEKTMKHFKGKHNG